MNVVDFQALTDREYLEDHRTPAMLHGSMRPEKSAPGSFSWADASVWVIACV